MIYIQCNKKQYNRFVDAISRYNGDGKKICCIFGKTATTGKCEILPCKTCIKDNVKRVDREFVLETIRNYADGIRPPVPNYSTTGEVNAYLQGYNQAKKDFAEKARKEV